VQSEKKGQCKRSCRIRDSFLITVINTQQIKILAGSLKPTVSSPHENKSVHRRKHPKH